MKPEKPRYITIMVMPETSAAEVRRLRVPRRWLSAGLGAVALLLLSAVIAVGYGWSRLRQSERVVVLQNENDGLRTELHNLDLRLSRAHDVVERLQGYEERLRSLTMVSDPARNLAIGPVGTSDPLQPVESIRVSHLRRALLSEATVDESVELMTSRIEQLEVESQNAEEKAGALASFLEGQRSRLASTPSRRPSPGYVSSTFGMRVDPFTGLPQFHSGTDFAANVGAPVSATADGVVIVAGSFGAFGNTVQIDHGHGLTTVYGHLNRVDVRPGDEVRRGDRVGGVGNTGRSTGPHLHYEVRLNGIPQDPSRFILD